VGRWQHRPFLRSGERCLVESRDKILSLLNITVFLAMVVVNALANSLPIAGKTTGELSAQYPNLFVPAGFTFSIWGLIYLLLFCFIIYQARSIFSSIKNISLLHDKISYLFFLSCLLNIAWIFSWHLEFVLLSVVIMLLLLLTLIIIYLRLNIGKEEANPYKKLFVHIPFSIYLGWISIATIANITAFLVSINWNQFGMSEEFWFVALLTISIILALVVLYRHKDFFFTLVVAWALIGIFAKHLINL